MVIWDVRGMRTLRVSDLARTSRTGNPLFRRITVIPQMMRTENPLSNQNWPDFSSQGWDKVL